MPMAMPMLIAMATMHGIEPFLLASDRITLTDRVKDFGVMITDELGFSEHC